MQRLVAILDIENRTTFTSKIELISGFEDQRFIGPLPNIYDANKNLLQMLGIIKLRVHWGITKITLSFISARP